MASEEGLQKLGVAKDQAAEFRGIGQCEGDLTKPPVDPTRQDTTAASAAVSLGMAGIGPSDLGLLEVHDCFTISGMLSLEAVGLADPGQAPAYVLDGATRFGADCAVNPTGGLVGFGHPTGCTGVRQVADLILQLTGAAGDCQVDFASERPHAMAVNMGGNDKTVVSFVMSPS